jgi:ribosome-binding factor A
MSDRRGRQAPTRRYPRTARVNEVLRQIVGEALEAVSDSDERLHLVTVTGIECDPDLRHARVFYSARTEGADEALVEQRVRLQAAIAKQTRLKRTPQLAFVEDSGVTEGWRIEAALKRLEHLGDDDG